MAHGGSPLDEVICSTLNYIETLKGVMQWLRNKILEKKE